VGIQSAPCSKERNLADDSGAAKTFGIFVGLLLVLFIGTGLLSAGGNAAGNRTLKIEMVKAE